MSDAIRARRFVDGRFYEREVRQCSWLTTDETYRLLGISRRQVFYLVARDALHPTKVSGRLRFPAAEVAQLSRTKRGERHEEA